MFIYLALLLITDVFQCFLSDSFYPYIGVILDPQSYPKIRRHYLIKFLINIFGSPAMVNFWMIFLIIDHSVPSADIWIRYIKTFHRKKEVVRFFMFRCRLFYIICFILLPYVPNRTAVVAICKVLRIDMKVNTIVLFHKLN